MDKEENVKPQVVFEFKLPISIVPPTTTESPIYYDRPNGMRSCVYVTRTLVNWMLKHFNDLGIKEVVSIGARRGELEKQLEQGSKNELRIFASESAPPGSPRYYPLHIGTDWVTGDAINSEYWKDKEEDGPQDCLVLLCCPHLLHTDLDRIIGHNNVKFVLIIGDDTCVPLPSVLFDNNQYQLLDSTVVHCVIKSDTISNPGYAILYKKRVE